MTFITHALCLLLGIFLASSPALAEQYHILITNDDGVDNPGLVTLADKLSQNYNVTVSAPAKNMSGNSHATNLFKGPLQVDESNTGKYLTYAVYGTPADAARFGIIQMRNRGTPANLVISGINPGSNIGALSHLSGTIGAAMEAQYHDIPAIALNLDHKEIRAQGYGAALDMVQKLITKIRKNGLPKGVILNVNIPAHSKGVKIVPMGPSIIGVKAFTKIDKTYKPELSFLKSKEGATTNDVEAYMSGYTAITPLKIDWTAKEILPALRKWSLE